MDPLAPLLSLWITASLCVCLVLALRALRLLSPQRVRSLWAAAAVVLSLLPVLWGPIPAPFAWLWAAGAAVLAGTALRSHRRALRALTDAVPVAPGIWAGDSIPSPMVCGPWHPRIYLPARLRGSERVYALCHEKRHIQRKDPAARLLGFVILCLHWFNPLLWLAYRLFCQDLETACDQAVLDDLSPDQQHAYTQAQHALFCPDAPLPALSLGFARTEEKRRFKHVLDYKYPRMLVVLMAVCVIALVSLLLVNDSDRESTHLEGVAITEGYVLDGSLPVDLPESLRNELVTLLHHHPHGQYTALDTFTLSAGCVVFSDARGGTTFALVPSPGGALSLVRTNHDGYTTARKLAPEVGLNTSEAYLAWVDRLETYLSQGRAEALYALKTPSMNDAPACSAILDALNLSRVTGPYTVQLNSESSPRNITLHIKTCPALASERQWQTEYLKDTAALILSLIGDAEQVTVVYDTMIFDNAITYTPKPAEDEASFETLYTSYRDKRSQAGFPSQTLTPTGVLYASPLLLPENTPSDPDTLLALFENSRFTLSRDRFTAQTAQPRSSRPPSETVYLKPRYTKSECPDRLALPDGTTLDLTRYEHRTVTNLYHESFHNSFYRIYALDDEVWISYWSFDDNSWNLLYLFQTEVLSQ